MTAETGNETEATKKRGRIPQSAWPHIVDRYRSGATLSAIAREFDCTPSAISYIIKKAEAAGIEPSAANGDADDETEGAEDVEMSGDGDDDGEDEDAPAEAPEAPAPRAATQQTLRLNPQPRPVEETETPVTPPAAPAQPAAPAPQAPQAAGGRPEPTPPVDAVEARLRETARGCLSAYRAWRQTPGEGSIQSLSDAVHELRKALSRVEIDMSASRRDEQAIRPIPIPAHRASRRTQ